MPRVAVLPDHIASQIAAGEVVERPASVIKEFVENSIDAGATHIEILCSHDMRDIRVADNGCGMEAEDAALAFQRHATSKITSAEDLTTLLTLGFRGEALPSIASISKFTCYTRVKTAATGTRVDIKDGVVTVSETGCAQGTIMEVSDLFYNVPARLKFLKKANTEFGHAQEIVQSLAVAHPGIVFEMRRADNVAFKTGGTGDTAQAAAEAKLFSGQETLCQVLGGDDRFNLKITGLVARPNHFRGDRKGVLSVVNKRPVRCPLTYKALEYAYSDLIPRGRHPFAVINIEIDPEYIDVNIHPTKKEIKYTDSNAIYMALHRAIGDALRQPRQEFLEAMYQTRKGEVSEAGQHESVGSRQSTEAVLQSIKMYSREELETEAPHLAVAQIVREKQIDFRPEAQQQSIISIAESPKVFEAAQLDFKQALTYSPAVGQTSSDFHLPEEDEISLPVGWRFAGYIHNTYFLFETKEGMQVIEQHIAHERLLYERLLKGQSTRGLNSNDVQRLCISAPLDLTAEQTDILLQARDQLAALGFDFDIHEDGTITCSQVPLELAHKPYATIIHQMLEDLADTDAAHIELEATKSIACQAAVKNGMTLSTDDILRLVSAWLKTPRNDTCPHGRPVRLKFSMEKLFEMFHPA